MNQMVYGVFVGRENPIITSRSQVPNPISSFSNVSFLLSMHDDALAGLPDQFLLVCGIFAGSNNNPILFSRFHLFCSQHSITYFDDEMSSLSPFFRLLRIVVVIYSFHPDIYQFCSKYILAILCLRFIFSLPSHFVSLERQLQNNMYVV